jgi:hypothetical protein
MAAIIQFQCQHGFKRASSAQHKINVLAMDFAVVELLVRWFIRYPDEVA